MIDQYLFEVPTADILFSLTVGFILGLHILSGLESAQKSDWLENIFITFFSLVFVSQVDEWSQ